MYKWNIVKSEFLNMTVEEKRECYKCGADFKTLNDIVDWSTYAKSDEAKAHLSVTRKHSAQKEFPFKKAKNDENGANSPETAEDDSEQDQDRVDETKNADKGEVGTSVNGEDIPQSEETNAVRDIADPSAKADKSVEEVPKSDELSTENQNADDDIPIIFPKSDVLNGKISLFTGDITSLEIDAIVNAANSALICGRGVDYAIHSAAGIPLLKAECWDLDGYDTGDAKITGGYKLPAKYVIHAVGPKCEYPELLSSCYTKSMDLLKEHGLETIAFPCISTGIYGYPNESAAAVALKTVRKWLDEDEYSSKVKRVIFCLFLDTDIKIYHKLLPKYFPL